MAIRGSIDSSKERGVLVMSYELQVASYELCVAILRKYICELRVPFYKLEKNITSCKLILKVEIKLRVAFCELRAAFYESQI